MDSVTFGSYVLGVAGLLLTLVGPIPDEYRIPGAILVSIFIVLAAVKNTNDELELVKSENRKTLERLQIHNDLIDIKAEIKDLRRRVK